MEHRNTNASAPCAAIAWLLIAALLCGGLPMFSGVVVVADSKPAFTLDVCHPLSGASYNLSPATAPLINALPAVPPPADWGTASEFAALLAGRPARTPDPPPPKLA